MELTVKTLTQNQEGHAMQMKIISAARAFAECNQKSNRDQQHKPYAEYYSHGFVGGKNFVGQI
jgi:hypothetical protein